MTKIGQGGGAMIAWQEFHRMRHDQRIQQVIGYWEALRAGRPAPMRAEIDPRGMDGALDRVFLAESIAPGVARFRLAGMALNDLMGMEIRGMPMTALLAPGDRDRFSDALARTLSGGVRTHLRLNALRGFNRPALEAEMVLLPVGNDRRERPLVLGCLVATGRVGRAPRRLEITQLTHEPFAIITQATEPPTQNVANPASVRATSSPYPCNGFSEPAARPYSAPRQQRGRPVLRVINNDN